MSNRIVLKNFGVFYCGGTIEVYGTSQITHEDTPQSRYIDQAQVHYLIPEKRSKPYPLVLIPGMGLRASLYLNTPNGRPGWARVFLDHGYEVYIFEEPTTVSSAFNHTAFRPEKRRNRFLSALAGRRLLNEGGGSGGVPHGDSQIPIACIDEICKSFSPVFSRDPEIYNGENPFNVKKKLRRSSICLTESGRP